MDHQHQITVYVKVKERKFHILHIYVDNLFV